MTLKVLGRDPLYLGTEREMCQYLDKVFSPHPNSAPFVDVALQVVDGVRVPYNAMSVPDNVLSISVDHSVGYGGVLWYCDGQLAQRISESAGVDVASHPWVSLNPSPPESDPRVLADPDCPTYFNRISALPLPVIRATVEEYFHAGTGFRPTRIQWVKGHFTGELYEEEPGV
ncbi:Imm1 family immunity protein [Streptomyces mesophilus]|uniref:Imm1 family immunity protein n=1 Tax=Streptomyces mesophilus TaxID=1775132 RepID=UPI00331FECF7